MPPTMTASPSDLPDATMARWKHPESEGQKHFFTGPVQIFTLRNGDEVHPAMVLNTELIAKYQQLPFAVRKCAEAKKRLRNQAERLNEQLQNADYDLMNAESNYDKAKRDYYKYDGKTSSELRRKLVLHRNEYRSTLKARDAIREKRSKLDADVQKAQDGHYELLLEIQNLSMVALDEAGIIPCRKVAASKCHRTKKGADQKADPTPSVVTSSTKRRATDPPEAPSSPPKKHIPSLPEATEEMLQAAENLRIQKERAKNVRIELEEHRQDYGDQLQTYADQRSRQVKDVEGEFGPVFCDSFIKLCKGIAAADLAVAEAKKTARDAGAPNMDDQRSNFSSETADRCSNDEYFKQSCIASIDPVIVEEWMDAVPSTEQSIVQVKDEDAEGYVEVAEDCSDPFGGGQRVWLDKEELQFQTTDRLLPVANLEDNWSDVAENEWKQQKIDRWKEECTRGRHSGPSRRVRSKSLHLLHGMPKPDDDPGFASERPAFHPLEGNLDDVPMTDSVEVVVQAPPASWPMTSSLKGELPHVVNG